MSRADFRLSTGGRIDRSRVLDIEFNGRAFKAYEGDTLASALLASGERLTARSFKYHRPRGIVSAGVEEPGTLVEFPGSDACGAMPVTTVACADGLRARTVNCWPSPRFDLGSALRQIAPLLPAGFYYKTFFWPSWRFYEPVIRRFAGLAKPPSAVDSELRFEARDWYCDVLVVGAGPAGLQAALTAARSGARVLLADRNADFGGSLLDHEVVLEGREGLSWTRDVARELHDRTNVTVLQNANAWGFREHNLVLICETNPATSGISERNWRVRAGSVILATGSCERMLVFPNNDLPGIMLASAVRSYLRRFAVRPGRRAVIFTNNSSTGTLAASMRDAGMEIPAIVDVRDGARNRTSAQQSEVLHGYEVVGARGRRRLRGVFVRPIAGGDKRFLACDLLAVSGGWDPSVRLWSQSRSELVYNERIAAYCPGRSEQDIRCVGAAAGQFELAKALAGGMQAGMDAARTHGYTAEPFVLSAEKGRSYDIKPYWHAADPESPEQCFVDLLNDVTLADVQLAVREGYSSIEHVKRYTTAGMGVDQGRTGNLNVIGAVSRIKEVGIAETGLTTYRSPTSPVSFGAIAGNRAGPAVLLYRHTPVTGWHIKQGAVMYEAGERWRRPGYYPLQGEDMQTATSREASAVRMAVGIYDGSPLGKFEVKGPDAGRLLDYVYTRRCSNLEAGQGRYGFMLTEDGLILDDGVCFKLGPSRFLVSASTANATAVYRHFRSILAVDRPEWNVMITELTSCWANATICGPEARRVLETLGTDIDIAPETFPFMGIRHGSVAGFPARIARVSYTGELSFEISVRARDLLALWQASMEAGREAGITPVGSEANHVLRVEKGFLSLGHEVDGTTDLHDLGMSWAIEGTNRDFVGRRALGIRRASGTKRRTLVGLLPLDPDKMIPEGAPITPGGALQPSEGLVTACVWSVANKRTVALALLNDGYTRMGSTVRIRAMDSIIDAEVTRPCFYDPRGTRLRS